MDDGCTIIDTLTTVCVSTPPLPPLPAAGVDLWHHLPAALILWVAGWGLVWLVRRDS